MLGSLPRLFTSLAQKYLPDAYLFAILLTFVVFGAGVAFQESSPLEMIQYWGDGFWNLLEFSMQMALILVTGFTLAKSKLVGAALRIVSSAANTNVQAVVLVTLVSCASCYINWGFGLVCSALFAVEVAKRVKRVNYGLLISSAYSGFLLWHGGLSGSIPLKLTSLGAQAQAVTGRSSIGLGETLYSPLNLILLGATLLALIILNSWMARHFPGDKEVVIIDEEDNCDDRSQAQMETSPASAIENSLLVNFGIAAFFILYAVSHFAQGGALGLNTVIFLFLGAGVLFHGRPLPFLNAFNASVAACAGILLQFPFYAGIMGMMSASGLASSLSQFFVSVSNENTFLFFTYLSAGIVNFFVPSGGGQWALQAPIVLPAAKALGVDFAQASMAVAWGDAWTNMAQPFWALPLLAAGKCSLRKMMGFSAVVFLAAGIVQGAVFLLFPMF